MRVSRFLSYLCLTSSLGFSQLTTEQKLVDFGATAGLFAKGYGPLDYKKSYGNFDVLDTAPWAAKVRATKNDIEFFEVMGSYLNGLDDAHSAYFMSSTFVANLNFGVDIYEGKLLVDFINRTRLPVGEFPFAMGYELVSIDGVDATRLLEQNLRYSASANPRATRRVAADYITWRPQQVIPSAPDVPEISTVVFRRYDGALETHRIPWGRSGLSWAGNGKLPAPRTATRSSDETQSPDTQSPSWMAPLERLWNCTVPDRHSVLGLGSVSPVFQRGLPSTFVQRLGRTATDFFFSGTYQAEGLRIGVIRIPSFSPSNTTAALTQFASEIAYMQANTDGLIVDEMRNPGGSIAYMHALLTYLHHYPFRGMAFEVRSTSAWIQSFSNSYETAKAQGASKQVLDLLEGILRALVQANAESRGMTTPLSIDDIDIQKYPARNNSGTIVAYAKPILVLVDEFSSSSADAFAALIQDSFRGAIVGMRTTGAGGNVTTWQVGAYSEGRASMTESLMSRPIARGNDIGYPTSAYIENVGVRPDIEYDYMTRANLFENGKPFVDAFTAAIVEQIRNFR